jgi:hypothetical protein
MRGGNGLAKRVQGEDTVGEASLSMELKNAEGTIEA